MTCVIRKTILIAMEDVCLPSTIQNAEESASERQTNVMVHALKVYHHVDQNTASMMIQTKAPILKTTDHVEINVSATPLLVLETAEAGLSTVEALATILVLVLMSGVTGSVETSVSQSTSSVRRVVHLVLKDTSHVESLVVSQTNMQSTTEPVMASVRDPLFPARKNAEKVVKNPLKLHQLLPPPGE